MHYKGFHIPGDFPMLARIFFLIPYYLILIRFAPVQRVLAKLPAMPSEEAARQRNGYAEALDKAWRASNFFLVRIFGRKDFCLPRTLVLYHWCRRNGVRAEIAIGVYKEDKDLKGHAWLKVKGDPYRENLETLEKYTIMVEK
jgi:hypothetical protein